MVIRPPCKTFTVQLLSITMEWFIWKYIHLFGLFIIVQHLEFAVTSMTSQPEGHGKIYHARICSEFDVLQTFELQSKYNEANIRKRLEVDVYLLPLNGNERIKHQLNENSSDCHLGYCIYYSYDGNKINVTFKINHVVADDTGSYRMDLRLIDATNASLTESGKIVDQPSGRFKISVDGGDQGDKPTRDCTDKYPGTTPTVTEKSKIVSTVVQARGGTEIPKSVLKVASTQKRTEKPRSVSKAVPTSAVTQKSRTEARVIPKPKGTEKSNLVFKMAPTQRGPEQTKSVSLVVPASTIVAIVSCLITLAVIGILLCKRRQRSRQSMGVENTEGNRTVVIVSDSNHMTSNVHVSVARQSSSTWV